uniref:Uncharacterized protein n=1 Tax=Timema bartmani TaxID=61472 RepID=A0A7R9F0B5_9NEOP|nr:unnamed protein product [Timema bartmani]
MVKVTVRYTMRSRISNNVQMDLYLKQEFTFFTGSAVCDRDEVQGYFGPVPALPVTERRGTSLLRTCYSVYLIRGAVTKRNSSFRLSGTGCECDVRGAVTKEQVVISQPIPTLRKAKLILVI